MLPVPSEWKTMEMEIDREELKRTESSLLEVIKMFRICEDTKKKKNH